jgi:hypothetical protein
VVAVEWIDRARFAATWGMPNIDTLAYHMPYSARFVQDGSFASLAFTEPDPLTTFYPANSELLHAIPMLFLGHDTLSPFLNLGWMALAMLAAWCLGRPFGASATTLLAFTVAGGCWLMTWSQAGDASNDITCLALLLCAAALLANAGRDVRMLALAAVPAGLALGTKFSLVAPVVALFAAVVIVVAPEVRRRVAVAWLVLVPLFGGFWYVRNLLATGNPFPQLKLGLGPLSLPATETSPALYSWPTGFDSTLASLLTHDGARATIESGLREDLGPAWWAIVLCAAAGVLGAMVLGPRILRALAAVAVVAAVAYVFTPTTGFFLWNFRHAIPALALGLILLALLPPLRGRRRQLLVAAGLTALFVTEQLGGTLAVQSGGRPAAGVAIAAALAAAAVALFGRAAPRIATRLAAVGAALLLVAGIAVGERVQDRYLRHRYEDTGGPRVEGALRDAPLRAAWQWARGLHGARIGLVGTELQYPLFGNDLSNRVRYVHASRDSGRAIAPVATCAAWRDALRRLRLDYVVITPVRFPFRRREAQPAELGWTRSLPGAREILHGADHVSVFRISGPPTARGCERV